MAGTLTGCQGIFDIADTLTECQDDWIRLMHPQGAMLYLMSLM